MEEWYTVKLFTVETTVNCWQKNQASSILPLKWQWNVRTYGKLLLPGYPQNGELPYK